MDYVATIECPDVLLSRNEGDEWLLCPVTARGRNWAEEHMSPCVYQDRSIVVRGFHYVVELFDSLTDSGLTVR